MVVLCFHGKVSDGGLSIRTNNVGAAVLSVVAPASYGSTALNINVLGGTTASSFYLIQVCFFKSKLCLRCVVSSIMF